MTPEQLQGFIDDGTVLEQINAVREKAGWEPLAAIPASDPGDPCQCVLGNSWHCSIEYLDDPDEPVALFDDLPNDVRERLNEQSGKLARAAVPLHRDLRFTAPKPIAQAIADVFGGEVLPEPVPYQMRRGIEEHDHGDAEWATVEVEGEPPPLFEWMFAFDSHWFPQYDENRLAETAAS